MRRDKGEVRKEKCEGGKKDKEEQEGHTDQQVAPPKNILDPSYSSDYTAPFHNSIISDPTLICLTNYLERGVEHVWWIVVY